MLDKEGTGAWSGAMLRLAGECPEDSGCQGPALQQGPIGTGALGVCITSTMARWSPSAMSLSTVCSGRRLGRATGSHAARGREKTAAR